MTAEVGTLKLTVCVTGREIVTVGPAFKRNYESSNQEDLCPHFKPGAG